jgi:hypothetical protein
MRISRIESGARMATQADLRDLLNLYNADAETAEVLKRHWEEDKRRTRIPWWSKYDALLNVTHAELILNEHGADSAYEFQPNVIPGLLQTAPYAREVIGHGLYAYGEDQISGLCEVRAIRQGLLTQTDPLKYHGIITEGALHARVGGLSVMREQLDHLTTLVTEHDNITLGVIPFAAGVAATQNGGLSLYQFPGATEPEIAFLELIGDTVVKDSAQDLRKFKRLFDNLKSATLSPEDSLTMIERAKKEAA